MTLFSPYILPTLLFAIICTFATTVNATAGSGYPLVYKEVNEFDWVWDDKGSGAHSDVSIWRPRDYQSGFYPLGDVAIGGYSKPNGLAATVSETSAGGLAPPASYVEIWADHGSGANNDVRILQLVPRSGFKCLGYAASNSYSSTPGLNTFRCVNQYYVMKGKYSFIWNDKGSGSDADVTFFSNTEIYTPKAVFTNTFTAFANYNDPPTEGPDMLSSDFAIRLSLFQQKMNKKYTIKVYELKDVKEIWTDKGSGASNDLAVYRPLGGTPVGDIPVSGYNSKPRTGLSVAAIKDDALTSPVTFSQRWNDAGSGAHEDVAFWEPRCHPGYVALGHVAVANHHQQPSSTDITCVKLEYTEPGRWVWIWDDHNSGAHNDVAVFQSVPLSHEGQGMAAMGAVPYHGGGTDRNAYVLKSSIVQYIVGRPTSKYILTDLTYFFNDLKTLSNTPEQLARTIVFNRGTTTQTVTRSIQYAYEDTRDWSLDVALEIGVSMTVTAGIPDVSSASQTVSMSTTTTHHTGESHSTSYTDEIDAQVTVKPKSQKTVIVSSRRYVADVPYKGTLTVVYADGTTDKLSNFRGTYRGAQVKEVRVTMEDDVPITS